MPQKTLVSWDINIVLNFLPTLGENSDMHINILGAKVGLLVLLSKMCRLNEVMGFTLSGMEDCGTCIQFTLPYPTKTFTVSSAGNTRLQKFTVHSFPDNELLCPVLALRSYISQTASLRGKVDHILVTVVQSPV